MLGAEKGLAGRDADAHQQTEQADVDRRPDHGAGRPRGAVLPADGLDDPDDRDRQHVAEERQDHAEPDQVARPHSHARQVTIDTMAGCSLVPRGVLVGLGALMLGAVACRGDGTGSPSGAGGAANTTGRGGAAAGGGRGRRRRGRGRRRGQRAVDRWRQAASAGTTAGAGGRRGRGGLRARAGAGGGAAGRGRCGGQCRRPSGRGGSGGAPVRAARPGAAAAPAARAAAPGGARPPVTAAPGTTLVKIEPAARRQTFEGWGTSLCWWANHVGGWSATARNAVVDAVVDPAAGLGYNIFRYNIGGGENPAHEHMRQ